MDSEYVYLYVGFGTLSILSSGWVATTYAMNPSLRQHPASLLAELSVFEVIAAYHSILFAVETEAVADALRLPEFFEFFFGWHSSVAVMTQLNQLVLTASTLAVLTSNIGICLDLILTLRNPFAIGSKRKKYYSLLQVLSIVYFTCYLWIRTSFVKEPDPDDQELEITNTGSVLILLMVYCAVAITSCFYAGLRFYYGLRLDTKLTKMYLLRHSMYVVTFFMLWFWPGLSYVLKEFLDTDSRTINMIAVATVTGSGLFLGCLRASDPAVWKRMKTCTFSQTERVSSGDVWDMPLSVVVASTLNSQITSWVYLSLHSVYSSYLESPTFKLQKTHSVKTNATSNDQLGVHDANLTVIDYEFEAFLSVIETSGLSIQDLVASFDPEANERMQLQDSSGKSGSFFMLTHDNKFLVKTIKSKEKNALLSLLTKYPKFMRNHEDSSLSRFFGLFTLKGPGVTAAHLLVMENVLCGLKPTYEFDLKGSFRGRTKFVDSGAVPGPYKDCDFYARRSMFKFDAAVMNGVCEQLMKDVKLLASYKLIDYSLYLCVSPYEGVLNRYSYLSSDGQLVYTVAIIDYLIQYDYFKFIEEQFSAKDASVKKPREYANRFINFMYSIVFNYSRKYNSSFNSFLSASASRISL